MSAKAEPEPLLPEDEQPGLGRLNNFVGFRLRRIQNHLSRQFSDAAAQYRLRSGALSALAIIEDNPGISQADIGRQIGMDSSAVVALIDELEERGWIARRHVPSDRRRRAIYLEPAGRETLDELFRILDRTEHAVLRALSSSELLLLNRTLDRIYDQI
ncbi:DNA-binding transcriptional regulator, MarR family [Sphingomonas guangdongensis]|uniref:DNA-binding transcriptional regulator, MarR family n=1 Tax=Sphingomonas guangdongensis TaxID=1141890 RepID=A0A285R2C5_9SPHN|nr:MarR family transcriptional regulator [Sphingomonas guangdongensis]SOB88241.1 DNA-binding transcriptional regulator, MarR family [Sphingomonas guangdongensis]